MGRCSGHAIARRCSECMRSGERRTGLCIILTYATLCRGAMWLSCCALRQENYHFVLLPSKHRQTAGLLQPCNWGSRRVAHSRRQRNVGRGGGEISKSLRRLSERIVNWSRTTTKQVYQYQATFHSVSLGDRGLLICRVVPMPMTDGGMWKTKCTLSFVTGHSTPGRHAPQMKAGGGRGVLS